MWGIAVQTGRAMALITLTSDFGWEDAYVGMMKGVILSLAPSARLVDLSHDVPPQNIEAAAYLLSSAVPYFPRGAVHLAVVDPGVGSARRPLLVTTPQASFVGPDNGLFSFVLDEPGAQAWVLDRPAWWLPHPGNTFHGRDVFAPVAAHLANGVPSNELGSPIEDAVRLAPRVPEQAPDGALVGHIVHVDHFGNLISNIPAAWLGEGCWYCDIAGRRIEGPRPTYAAVQPGQPVLLVSSNGTAEIAVREGHAARQLGIRVGAQVRLSMC